MNPDTLRSAMLQKLANSNEVGLIRALFELSRFFDISADQCQEDLEYLFNGDLKDELNKDFKKEAVTLNLIFERLLESAVEDDFDLAYLLLEAMGKPDGTLVQGRTTEHQIPSNPRCLEATLHIVSACEEKYVINTTFVQMLLNAGAKVDTPTRTGDTALILATKIGNRRICKILLKRGADVNAVPGQETRMTALQAAAECGQRGLISLFIHANAKINAPGNLVQGRTALQAAAGAGYIKTAQDLISLGADINAVPSPNLGRTALQAAAEVGNMELTKMLANAGAQINAPPAESYGLTALQAAAKVGNIEIMDFLLRAGADVNAPAGAISGRTALQSAAEKGKFTAVKFLLDAGADVDTLASGEGGISALYAISQHPSTTAKWLLMILHRSTSLSDQRGHQAALKWAVQHRDNEIVKHLIDLGVNPNAPRNDILQAALQVALSSKNFEIVQILLDSGADVNALMYLGHGYTALHKAVVRGNLELVHILIAKGANPNASCLDEDAYGLSTDVDSLYYSTTLENAVSVCRTSIEIIRSLIEAGAHINGPSTFYRGLPLQIAVAEGNVKAVDLLLDEGANVDGTGVDKTTPLQKAAKNGNIDLVEMLLNAGADINAPPEAKEGSTTLQFAVAGNNIQLVRLLLQYGADVNAPAAEIRGATALQRAAIVGHLRITLELLESGADINAPGAKEDGRTALDAAAEHGRLDILHLLLKNDDQQDKLPARCEQAANLASQNGHLVIARILREFKSS